MSIQTDDFAPAPAKRVISAVPASPQEEAIERALRPKLLQEYVGQAKAREQLEIFIGAAKKRGEALDHVLLFGPPGLGKTTLSHIIAAELGVNLRQTSGPVLEKPKDLAALLTNLEKNDVLFIDEIHRLSPVVEEILYPALEDYQIDIMIGEGPAARSIKLDLQPFTLVGATTRGASAPAGRAKSSVWMVIRQDATHSTRQPVLDAIGERQFETTIRIGARRVCAACAARTERSDDVARVARLREDRRAAAAALGSALAPEDAEHGAGVAVGGCTVRRAAAVEA